MVAPNDRKNPCDGCCECEIPGACMAMLRTKIIAEIMNMREHVAPEQAIVVLGSVVNSLMQGAESMMSNASARIAEAISEDDEDEDEGEDEGEDEDEDEDEGEDEDEDKYDTGFPAPILTKGHLDGITLSGRTPQPRCPSCAKKLERVSIIGQKETYECDDCGGSIFRIRGTVIHCSEVSFCPECESVCRVIEDEDADPNLEDARFVCDCGCRWTINRKVMKHGNSREFSDDQ